MRYYSIEGKVQINDCMAFLEVVDYLILPGTICFPEQHYYSMSVKENSNSPSLKSDDSGSSDSIKAFLL